MESSPLEPITMGEFGRNIIIIVSCAKCSVNQVEFWKLMDKWYYLTVKVVLSCNKKEKKAETMAICSKVLQNRYTFMNLTCESQYI